MSVAGETSCKEQTTMTQTFELVLYLFVIADSVDAHALRRVRPITQKGPVSLC